MAATYRFDVKWGDTDAAGIVFYPNFYKWMDEATHHFFAAAGFPSSRLLTERQTIIPLLEAHCQFKSPLQFEDEVEVQSEIQELRKKVFKIGHRFIKDGQPVAEGYEIRAWAHFNEKPKAFPIPEDIKEILLAGTSNR